MTATTRMRGRKISLNIPLIARQWLDENFPCKRCNRPPTAEGHDACLGVLPGVRNACCGHGVYEGWIRFHNGRLVKINSVKEWSNYITKG